jgi:glycerate 2-kinase
VAEGLRAAARALLEAAIRAGDAGALVEKTLGRSGERLRIAGREIDLRPVRRVLVLGAGKASAAMAAAVY